MKKRKIALILSCVLGITGLIQNPSIAATKGWSRTGGVWYFYDLEGNMKTGWINDGGAWYYLNLDGAMETGWKNINGVWYYFNSNGTMKTGWLNNNGIWYYLKSDGSMATGWIKDNGEWYYLNSNGSMAYDTTVDNYILDTDGKWIDKSEDNIEENNIEEDTLINSIERFSEKAAVSVLNDGDKAKNKLFSPISLFGAVSVLSEGAADSTKDKIREGLCLSDKINLPEEYMKFADTENIESEDTKLKLANSVWLNNKDKSIKFKDDTIKGISKKYKADIFKEDLTSEECAKKISNWISKNTYGMLGTDYNEFKKTPDSDIKMEIFNTIYFKDSWRKPFYVKNTKKDKFTLSDNTTIDTEFMNKWDINYLYDKKDEYTISTLEFKDGNKISFVLPAKGKSPYDILNNTDKLKEVLKKAKTIKDGELYDVNYKIPKFKYNYNLDLNKTMVDIGFSEIYSSNADFSNFTDSTKLYVDNVKQNAVISVDENGAEAAAFTEIDVTEGSASVKSREEREFILDRPFLFMIMDSNELPIFIGILNNPLEK